MELFARLLALFIAGSIVAAGGTFAEWCILSKVRCPKCHRVMQRRHAWYYCGHCDCYVIFDFAAFWRHWNPEEINGKNNSTSAGDQT